jgi:hypothetical protein
MDSDSNIENQPDSQNEHSFSKPLDENLKEKRLVHVESVLTSEEVERIESNTFKLDEIELTTQDTPYNQESVGSSIDSNGEEPSQIQNEPETNENLVVTNEAGEISTVKLEEADTLKISEEIPQLSNDNSIEISQPSQQSSGDDLSMSSPFNSPNKVSRTTSSRYKDKPKIPMSEVPPADPNFMKLMRQTSGKLLSFDYGKLRGSIKSPKFTPGSPGPSISTPRKDTVSISKITDSTDTEGVVETQNNGPLRPKKLKIQDKFDPPGGYFYEYEDLIRINTVKEYGILVESELEAYLSTEDFQKVFKMTRVS